MTDDLEPDDQAFDAWIENNAPSLNAPPATPTAEMWSAISERTRPVVIPIRRTRWIVPVSIAAALLIGVGVDRYAFRAPASSPAASVASAQVRTEKDSADPARLYRVVAVQTLSQAEALLTAYRANGSAPGDSKNAEQLGTWGRQVLSSTRLLMDSPAGDDAQLRPLLQDLEVVLVQIVRLTGAPLDAGERALIDDVLKDRNLVPRIRSAVPAGASSATTE